MWRSLQHDLADAKFDRRLAVEADYNAAFKDNVVDHLHQVLEKRPTFLETNPDPWCGEIRLEEDAAVSRTDRRTSDRGSGMVWVSSYWMPVLRHTAYW
jgi:hypothetical protein